jgi:hypothetical protein
MTENELLATIASNGWEVLQTQSAPTEGGMTHKALAICKPNRNVLLRQWARYYVRPDGTCYWQDADPFESPAAHPDTFNNQLMAAIDALVDADQIKAGYIERQNDLSETAVVVIVATDNTTKLFHVYKDESGAFQKTAITGTYPIG